LFHVESPDDELAKALKLEIFRNQTDPANVSITIDVKKNQNLSDERDALHWEGMSENVLILFFDTTSRRHFHRKLPKLMSWVEQFITEKDHPEFESFEYLKYHTAGGYTITALSAAYANINYEYYTNGAAH
jgi:hypothetical protein